MPFLTLGFFGNLDVVVAQSFNKQLTLLDVGFVCLVEVPNTVPGFAPSVRGEYYTQDDLNIT